ncbi:MAG: hypothetical protein EOP00_26435 [Pedobacter sp.]|nr:MAG: hypothetical protein EOP00_26435 [Pedobacter sp.]
MTAAPDGENFVSRKMIYVAPQERRERAVNYGGLCKKYLRLNPEGLTTNEILQKILEDFPELDPTHAQTRVYNTVFRYNRDKIIESIDGPGYKKYVMVQNKK